MISICSCLDLVGLSKSSGMKPQHYSNEVHVLMPVLRGGHVRLVHTPQDLPLMIYEQQLGVWALMVDCLW